MNSNTEVLKHSDSRAMNAVKSKSGLIIALAALVLIFGILTGWRFLEPANVINLIRTV